MPTDTEVIMKLDINGCILVLFVHIYTFLYLGGIYLLGSASAELFADAALCPLEMVKVKIQTSIPGTFPTNMFAAISKMIADPTCRFPFGSLVPLWSRQVP